MTSTRPPRRCFFGIGVNRYANATIVPLRCCARDVHKLGTLLEHHEHFDQWILIDQEATQDEVVAQLRQALESLGAGDLLVLFLAMHGAVDEHGDQILYLHSADPRHARSGIGTMRMSVLRDMVGEVADLDVLILVDACRASLLTTRAVDAPAETERLPTRDAVAKRLVGAGRRARITELYACSDGERTPELKTGNGLLAASVYELWRGAAEAGEAVVVDGAFVERLRERMVFHLTESFGDQLTVNPMYVQGSSRPPIVLAGKNPARRPPEPPKVVPAPSLVVPAASKFEVAQSIPEGRVPKGCRMAAGDNRLVDGWWWRVQDEKTGIVLVRIPAGTFEMGSDGPDAFDNEKPVHTVEIRKAYYLAETPVTVGEWRKFAATGHRTLAEREGWGWSLAAKKWEWEKAKGAAWSDPLPARGFRVTDEHPATQVSFEDAEAFCRWAGMELPTEAQRERAARGGTTTKFWWGEDERLAAKHCNLAGAETKALECTWASDWDDGYPFLAPVRARESWRNQFGLYSMLGNCWEWCTDYWDEKYFARTKRRDPKNTVAGDGGRRVVRGGAWNVYPRLCRVSRRHCYPPSVRDVNLGFRVARTDA